MKLSVLGAGAVGCMIGGLIKQHAPEVDLYLVGRGEHGSAMRRTGRLSLRGDWGSYQVPVHVCETIGEIAGSDYVLLTVKSQVTDEVMRAAEPHLGSAVVISLQNGLNQRVLAQHLPPEQFLIGMTAANMALVEPGVVSLQRNGFTMIGSCLGREAAHLTDPAVGLLKKSGLPVRGHDHIVGVQYNKIAINAIGYSSVLSQSCFLTECVLDASWRRWIALPILQECQACYRQAGLQLPRVPGASDLRRFRMLLRLLEWPVVGQIAGRFVRGSSRQRIVYSVEQDLLRGRATEVDYVNGEVVRLAREHGGDAPLNALVLELTRELERRGDGTFFSKQAVIERFRDQQQGAPVASQSEVAGAGDRPTPENGNLA